MESHHSTALYFALFYVFSAFYLHLSHAQQTFLKNDGLDCYTDVPSINGYICNGLRRSCNTFLIFRSQPPYYDSAVGIGYLLRSDPTKIAEINGVTDVEKIPKDSLVIVPVNCACAGRYYQHNSSYTMKFEDENYYIIANVTYQGLTTCKAMINQNIPDSRQLDIGMRFVVPIRCACPTRNQTAKGVKLLMTYLITWSDTISDIGERFDADEQSLLDANELTPEDEIYPFNPLLVPLKRDPTRAQTLIPPPPPSESPIPPINASVKGRKCKPALIAGIGIGTGLVLLLLLFCGLLVWFRRRRNGRKKKILDEPAVPEKKAISQPPIFPKGVIREAIDSLTVYTFAELQEATRSFSDECRIKGSVYRGIINGDVAAIKRLEGSDVSKEIDIMKQINHSHVIRLSGFCTHEGDTYLVYEYAENGSLSDWLHEKGSRNACLSWKERVQMAFDIIAGLNYLHNYASPPYIHMDMKSSNVLIDADMRAKVANFGLARAMEETVNGQLTRHVVGTQGYLAPEYLEHGLITTKIDVYAFGVVMLELLSGRRAVTPGPGGGGSCGNDDKEGGGGGVLLSTCIREVLEGEGAREKVRGFVDPCLGDEYPMSLAWSLAHLALDCTGEDSSSRPTTMELHMSLLKILSSSLDWDPLHGPSSDSFPLNGM